ncbi:MAG: hypothetical protein ABR582_00285 [Gemmatimonadaceae bacterium]
MSRAFVNEDSNWGDPSRRITLPPRDDPAFDEAAAEALLEAARDGQTGSAEMATGYYWGETRLKPHVERILARARAKEDERLIQLAERFLK